MIYFNLELRSDLHPELFNSFKAVVASFDSDDACAAHFHNAVGLEQLYEGIDLLGLTGELTYKSCWRVVNDL